MQVYAGIKHCRVLKYCLFGVKRWCTRYDIDFKKLVRGEMPVEELEAVGDAMGKKVAALAREVANGR